MARDYFTVVYAIDDQKAWDKEWKEHLHPLFLRAGLPFSIVAACVSDEITRMDLIRDAVEEFGYGEIQDAIQEILDAKDPVELFDRKRAASQ